MCAHPYTLRMGLFDGTSLERPVTCERCGKTLDDCACPRDASGDVRGPEHQAPRVRREKRRGKWTTIVTDLDPVATDLKALLKELRTALGTGGGISSSGGDGELIIQGDHRDSVVEKLIAMGYKAKASGG
ncbi:MAG: stress response translation initiation inhibitor YciH [Phycisphaerales bacterium]